MDIDPTNWAWSQIAEKRLSTAQSLVLLAIARRASIEHEGICWPGSTDVHVRVALDARWVRRLIRQLADLGLFQVVPCTWSTGTRTSNLYVLNLPGRSVSSEFLKNIRMSTGRCFDETLIFPGGKKLHFGEGPQTQVKRPTHPPDIPLQTNQGNLQGYPGLQTQVPGSTDPGLQTQVPGSIDPGGPGSIDPGIRRFNIEGESLIKDLASSKHPADDDALPFGEYFQKIQETVARLPGCKIRSVDRRLIREFHSRHVPAALIESACWLAVRRAMPSPDTFTAITSFRYFKPAIEELLETRDKALFRQAAYIRLQLLGENATEEDHREFERMYGGT